MSWIDDVKTRIDFLNAVVSQMQFNEEGTSIDLTSLPGPNLILKVRYLERRQSGVKHFFRERRRCDVVALIASLPKPTMIFIEAKSGIDRNNTDSSESLDQLASSLQIMSDAIDECALDLPFESLMECNCYATCVMESMRADSGANQTQRKFENDFYRKYRVPLRFVPADQDIWQAIQGNTT